MMAPTLRASQVPWLLSGPALVLYACFLLTPLGSVLLLSFHHFELTANAQQGLTLANYAEALADGYFLEIYARTFGVGLAITFACAVFGTMEAIVLSRMANPWRGIFLMVVLGPLLVSVVVRTLGWALLFGSTGLISQAAMALRLTDSPIDLMYTNLGVSVALVHVLVPFMVVAVWAALQRLNPATEAAARSLGANSFVTLHRVILPQIAPGILAGSIMVFAMAVSAFATPAIIGGRRLKTVATATYDEFLNTLNWPLGASLAVILLVSTTLVLFTTNRLIERRFGAVFNG